MDLRGICTCVVRRVEIVAFGHASGRCILKTAMTSPVKDVVDTPARVLFVISM